MARKMGSKKEEFERLRRHHRAFQANSHLWDVQGFVPEPRVVMILNRFTRNLIVMYASQACGTIFNIEPEQIEGKPILLFVRSDELGIFVENVGATRSSGSIMNIRFWFQSPNLAHEVPCEAVIFGCSDGIVAIMRQCKPFVRRYLIGGMEHNRSMAGNWPRHWYVTPSPSGSMASTSPSSSISSTPPKLTMSRLKNIRVVDRHDRSIRPLEEVAKVDPYLAKDIDLVTEKLGVREFSIQDNVQEVSDSEEDDIDISERNQNQVQCYR
ncbi:hypothetical protein BGZ80_011674 [Entomortierella chlamydospora]|uniref:Uncharacterized protein n=1 Tax=Entomortierella chlamydospora TaxID=101097 RepID=A0A9P6N3T2_9FUNG|nr:hypothetical protein BGZ80_011674 [Entomortierella chlamydospora]